MQDAECIAFLRRHLPRLGLRWAGFRKVRRTVCKRLQRRLAELALPDLQAYEAHLARVAGEMERLDAMCRIPISRFYRDRAVFDCLCHEVVPTLAKGAAARGALRCWSAGCASGEEPYTLALLWEVCCRPNGPALSPRITATDADPVMIQRAQQACYGAGSLRDLPQHLRAAFVRRDDRWCLPERHRRGVTFLLQDIRREMPEGPFDLILCRNLVLTYFDATVQRSVLPRLLRRLNPGGALVIGRHEVLPETSELEDWRSGLGIFRRISPARA